MTIGVALKCRQSVVLACDSQATLGNAPYKSLATKLEQLDHYHGLIMAGAEPISKQVTHTVKGYLQSEQNPTTERISDISSDVMSSLYREYARRFGRDPVDVANDFSSQFLIGGYDENEGPQVYAVSSPGLFSPVDDYGLIGSGIFYAGTILKKEFVKDMHSERGQFLATRAVIEAAEMDPHVGGQIRLATIYGPPNGFIEIPGYVEGRYRPLVEKATSLRRDLDTILLGEEEGREEAMARLLDSLGAFGMGPIKLIELSEIANRFRRE